MKVSAKFLENRTSNMGYPMVAVMGDKNITEFGVSDLLSDYVKQFKRVEFSDTPFEGCSRATKTDETDGVIYLRVGKYRTSIFVCKAALRQLGMSIQSVYYIKVRK